MFKIFAGLRLSMSDQSEGSSPEDLLAELQRLRIEHKDLSDAVEALELLGQPDQLQIRRFKRRKLALKDRIQQIEDLLTPDIIA
jgi:hypothetical protein